MSPYDDATRPFLRVGLAALVVVHLVGLAVVTGLHLSLDRPHPDTPALLVAFGRSGWVWPVAALGVAATLLFARRRAPLASGLVALAALSLLAEGYAAVRGGHGHNVHFSGGPLLGWLLGLAAARLMGSRGAAAHDARDDAREEAFAEAGAVAVLAAMYVESGLSKLLLTGLEWADGTTLRALVLSQLPVDVEPGAAARLVLDHPALAQGAAAAALVAEVGAFLYPWHRATRAAWGALLIAFHVGAWLIFRIFYLEAVAAVALLSFPWPRWIGRLRGRPAAAPPPPWAPAWRGIGRMVAVLLPLLAGTVALAHAAGLRATWSNLQRPESPARHAAPPPAAHLPPAEAAPRPGVEGHAAALGPLRVGRELAPGIVVKRLGVRGDALDVRAATGRSAVTLTVSLVGTDPPAVAARWGAADPDLPARALAGLDALLGPTRPPPALVEAVAAWRRERARR